MGAARLHRPRAGPTATASGLSSPVPTLARQVATVTEAAQTWIACADRLPESTDTVAVLVRFVDRSWRPKPPWLEPWAGRWCQGRWEVRGLGPAIDVVMWAPMPAWPEGTQP